MKRILKIMLGVCLSLIMLAGASDNVFAASASLDGASTVRAGDTITLSLNVSHNGSYGLTGTLSYDSSQVSLTETKCGLSGWLVENSGNDLVVYDNNLSNPLSGTKTVLTLKFKVNNSVAEGTRINISINNLNSSDGNADTSLGAATYSVTVAKPLSSNANLASLSVSGASLNPAFSAGTTNYNLGEVEYSTSKLDISYTTEDSNASVSVRGNSLSVGSNTVSVIVTAEDGSSKTYKLNVTRKQDPNYVAGSNANLKELTVNQGIISPVFKADVTDYIVYLPYEKVGTSFTVSGSAADAKAKGVVNGTIDKLVEGENRTVVVCKAEDGTEKSYAVTVVVMPKYTGEVPNVGGGNGTGSMPEEPTEIPSEEETETTTEENSQNPSEDNSKQDAPDKTNGGAGGIITIFVVLVVIALIGALVYVLFFTNKKF